MSTSHAKVRRTDESALRLIARESAPRGAETELCVLNASLIDALEEERGRIARELHDDLNQRLALLAIELEQLAGGVPKRERYLRSRLLDLRARAEEVSVDLHRMSHQLHPSTLDHLGLVVAVKGFCEEMSQRYGMEIDLAFGDVPSNIPKPVALCLFRIVQEALRNVIRHSGTRQARVVLRGAPRALRLTVSDSGIGFDVEAATARLGLGTVSMRERVRLVDGAITIVSRPQCGTRVEVRVPLEESR